MKGENSLTNKENKEVFKNKDTTKQKQLNQKTADLRKDDQENISLLRIIFIKKK